MMNNRPNGSPEANMRASTFDNNGNCETLSKMEYYTKLQMGSQHSLSVRNSTMNRTGSSYYLQRSKENKAIYKPSGKVANCKVLLLDGDEKDFKIDSAYLGQNIFDDVCDHLSLNERQYFGLKFNDKSTKIWFWLKLDKKISEQLGKNEWNVEFQVKFYPPHEDTILEDITRYFFCLQVRQDIMSKLIPLSYNVLVLLCAYVVQSEASEQTTEQNSIEYLREMPLAPADLQNDEFLRRVNDLRSNLVYLSPEEADRRFMWNATKLSYYGVDMHKTKDSKNNWASVGVFHSGILVYHGRIRMAKYSWAKILNLSYKNKYFVLKLRATDLDKKERILEFNCVSSKLARRLWQACKEHHEFFRLVDAENPKKPVLKGTVNLSKLNQSPSPLVTPSTPSILLQRPQPKVKRNQTQRRERDVPLSPTGIAPVAHSDDLFNEEGNREPRPELVDETWKMTPYDCTGDIGITPDGLDIAAKEDSGWQGCRSNFGVKGPGKYYYEGNVKEDGLIRLGWATNDARLELGSDEKGFGYGDNVAGDRVQCGYKANSGKEEPYGEVVHEGDNIGCLIDFDKGKILWTKNGMTLGPAYNIPDQLKDEPFFPTSSTLSGRILFNFGDSPLQHIPNLGNWQAVSEADPKNVSPNYNCGWKLNPFDTTKNAVVSGNGTDVQSKMNDQWEGCRSNKGVFDAGKYYYEVIPLEDGLARIGWSTHQASLNLGNDALGFGYGADNDGFGISGNQGKRLNNAEIDNYGEPFGKNDVIGCYIDLDNRKIKWSKNGEIFGEAFNISEDMAYYNAFYPTASLLNNTLNFNFGDTPFQFYPGADWSPISCAAFGNTDNSKKVDPSMYRNPNIDREESVLDLRRQKLVKSKRENDERERMKAKEEERRRNLEEQARIKAEREREEHERRKREEERQRQIRLEKEMRRKEEEEEIIERQREEQVRTYQTTEKCDPEIIQETYVDDQGRTVMRTVRKSKTIIKTVSDRQEDDILNIKNRKIITSKDDEDILAAIFCVTGFDVDIIVSDEKLML